MVVHDAPDARDVVLLLLAPGLYICLCRPKQFLDTPDSLGTLFPAFLLQKCRVLVYLVTRPLDWDGLFTVLDHLAYRLVRL